MASTLWMILAILLAARLAVRSRSFPVGVLTVLLAVFYGLRGAALGFGLDDSVHLNLLLRSNTLDLVERVGAVLFVFMFAFWVSYATTGPPGRVVQLLLPIPGRPISEALQVRMMVCCTTIAALIAASVIVRYGSFAAAIAAAKSDRVSGDALLRIPATVTIILAASNLRSLGNQSSLRLRRNRAVLAAGCLLIGAGAASAWGSRQFAIIALGYVLLTPAIRAFRTGQRGWLTRTAATTAALLATGLGLRLYRDEALGGTTAVTAAEGDLFRQVSIASNGALLDNSLLAVRDFPSTLEYRGGSDFWTGLWGSLPRSLRPADLEFDSIGAMFHRIYEPAATSGWPIGGPFEWYINFGWIGVAVGGLLSGALYRAIADALRQSPMPELATMTTLVLTLIVFPLGVSSSTPNRFVIHAGPLLALLYAANLRPYRTSAVRQQHSGALLGEPIAPGVQRV